VDRDARLTTAQVVAMVFLTMGGALARFTGNLVLHLVGRFLSLWAALKLDKGASRGIPPLGGRGKKIKMRTNM
jgi:hypothetical protein